MRSIPFAAIGGILMLAGGLAVFFAATNLKQAQGALHPHPVVPSEATSAEFVTAALRVGDLERLGKVLAGAPDRPLDDQGRSALHLAASTGSLEGARFLLSRGADPNRADLRGRTPLMDAAEHGDASLVLALLDAGAVPSAMTRDGRDALALAKARTDAEGAQIVMILTQAGR